MSEQDNHWEEDDLELEEIEPRDLSSLFSTRNNDEQDYSALFEIEDPAPFVEPPARPAGPARNHSEPLIDLDDDEDDFEPFSPNTEDDDDGLISLDGYGDDDESLVSIEDDSDFEEPAKPVSEPVYRPKPAFGPLADEDQSPQLVEGDVFSVFSEDDIAKPKQEVKEEPKTKKLSLKEKMEQARALENQDQEDKPKKLSRKEKRAQKDAENAAQENKPAPVVKAPEDFKKLSWKEKIAAAKAEAEAEKNKDSDLDPEPVSTNEPASPVFSSQESEPEPEFREKPEPNPSVEKPFVDPEPVAEIQDHEESGSLLSRMKKKAQEAKEIQAANKAESKEEKAKQSEPMPEPTPETDAPNKIPSFANPMTQDPEPAKAFGGKMSIKERIAAAKSFEKQKEVVAGADVSAPSVSQRIEERLSFVPSRTQKSEFELLLTPLSGPELAAIEQEVQEDTTLFDQVERAQGWAVLQEKLGYIIGLVAFVLFALSVGYEYLTDVLPNAELPHQVNQTKESFVDIVKAGLFGIGLLLPIMAIWVVAASVSQALRGLQNIRVEDIVMSLVSASAAGMMFMSLARGQVITALATWVLWGLISAVFKAITGRAR